MDKKYLEAWNFIKDQMSNFTFSHLVEEMNKNSNIVDNALQRLNAIDNTKFDEALGKVAILASEMGTSKDMKFAETRFPKMLITVQQALQKAQEQEKENAEYKDIEENIGCPFKVIEHLINMIEIFFEKDNKLYIIDDYDIKNNTINFKSGTRLPDYKFCRMNHEIPFILYGKMFWLKEDKSE